MCEINGMASSMLFFNHGDFTGDLSSAAFVCCEYITLSRNENNPCYFLWFAFARIFASLCSFAVINWHINLSHSSSTVREFAHKLALIVLIPKLLIHPSCKNPQRTRDRVRRVMLIIILPTQLSTTRIHARSWARMRVNRALPLTWLFEFFRCSPERRQETAQSVLREQESLLSALQPRFHPEEEHDAASAPRVRHGAQVPVSLLRQALQVHAEHLRAHPKISSRSGIVLQALVLNNPIGTFSSANRELERVIISLFFVRFRSISRPLSMLRK